jgi:hypothetical protein
MKRNRQASFSPFFCLALLNGLTMNNVRRNLVYPGQRFGKLVVIRETFHLNPKGARERDIECLCDCGNKQVLPPGKLISKKGNENWGCQHCNQSTHGVTHTRLYNIWSSMKQRTRNPNNREYEYYGERGITMPDNWYDNFIEFQKWAIASGYNDALFIDREEVNGNYCPENCRWVSRRESLMNKRKAVDNNIYFIEANIYRPFYVDILRFKKRVFKQYCYTIEEARNARDRFLEQYESQFPDSKYARKIRNDIK